MKTAIPALGVLCAFILTGHAQAQDQAKPAHGWKHSLAGALGLTQVAFKDWRQGGEGAVAWAFTVDGRSTNDQAKTNWSNAYKFAFGQTKTGKQDARKTDDRIDLETILTYNMDLYVNPYMAVTLKTQFARGYKYDEHGGRTPVSQFFDPANLTQSAGLGYQPVAQVKTRIGVAVREILTHKFPAYADDPQTQDKIEKTRVDGGLESVTDLEWKPGANLLLRSRVELFAPFKDVGQTAARSDNTFAVKMGKYVSVGLSVQVVNDPAASPRTQIKEAITLGLSYVFL